MKRLFSHIYARMNHQNTADKALSSIVTLKHCSASQESAAERVRGTEEQLEQVGTSSGHLK